MSIPFFPATESKSRVSIIIIIKNKTKKKEIRASSRHSSEIDCLSGLLDYCRKQALGALSNFFSSLLEMKVEAYCYR